jgi:hypothetical protein
LLVVVVLVGFDDDDDDEDIGDINEGDKIDGLYEPLLWLLLFKSLELFVDESLIPCKGIKLIEDGFVNTEVAVELFEFTLELMPERLAKPLLREFALKGDLFSAKIVVVVVGGFELLLKLTAVWFAKYD